MTTERDRIPPAVVTVTRATEPFVYCRMCRWRFYSPSMPARYEAAKAHSMTHTAAEHRQLRHQDMLPEAAYAHAPLGIWPFADLILNDEVIAACKEAPTHAVL